MEDLGIDRGIHVDCSVNANDPVDKATELYKNHPSILRINQEVYLQNKFSFQPISESKISNISNIKASQNDQRF